MERPVSRAEDAGGSGANQDIGDWDDTLQTVGEGPGGPLGVTGSEAHGYGKPHTTEVGQVAGLGQPGPTPLEQPEGWEKSEARPGDGEVTALAAPANSPAQPQTAKGAGTLGDEGGGLAETGSAGLTEGYGHQRVEGSAPPAGRMDEPASEDDEGP